MHVVVNSPNHSLHHPWYSHCTLLNLIQFGHGPITPDHPCIVGLFRATSPAPPWLHSMCLCATLKPQLSFRNSPA